MKLPQRGTLYEHTFDGQPKKIIENSDIIYLDGHYQELIIKKDGAIYLDKEFNHKGTQIATIENAVQGSIRSSHMAVVTENGELYMTSMFKKGIEISKDLKLITDIPKVKKVICLQTYTCFLTYEGDIYALGKIINKNYNVFTKISNDSKFTSIEGSENTLVALDNKNNVSVLGDVYFHSSDLTSDLKNTYKDISQIYSSYGFGVALKQNGKVMYWGERNSKHIKSVESFSGTLKMINSADKVLTNGKDIYIFQDDKIIKANIKE